jgi:O-antigen/teichoic acid export membrane protein
VLVAAFASQMVIAKLLTAIELGEIKIIQSFIGVATIMGVFGFDSAILKLCSENCTIEEKISIFKVTFKKAILTSLIVSIVLAIGALLKCFSPDIVVNKWMFAFILSIPPLVFNALIMGYLQALKDFKKISQIQIIARLICAVVQIYGTYKYGFTGFAITTLMMSFVPLIILLYYIKGILKIHVTRPALAGLKRIYFYSKWSFADNAIGATASYIDMFLLNYLILDRAKLGSYGLATIFLLGLTYVNATAQSMTTPYFSEKSGNKVDFIRVIIKYEKLMILLSFFIAVFAIVFVPFFIHFVYGNKYQNAGLYFQILAIKFFFTGCVTLLGTARLGLGLVRLNFALSVFMLVNTIACTFVGIKLFGVMGAALGQTLASFFGVGIILLITIKAIKKHFSLPLAIEM